MEDKEVLEQRYRFFAEKGVAIAVEQDRTFVTIFTAIIAGLMALVVYDKVGFWSGTFFLFAVVMAVMGLAFCLLHMAFASKVMLTYAAYFSGEEYVPNVLEGLELTEDAVWRLQNQAQGVYSSQLAYLFLSVFAAGIGLAIDLWPHIKAMGLVFAILLAVLFVVGLTIRMFVQIRARRRARMKLERSSDE